MNDNTSMAKNISVGKLILFVLPTIIALLVSSVYSIVDGVFVSNVGGTTAFAAINQVAPIFLVVASIGFMFGTGGTALVSKVQGEGNSEKARRIFLSIFTWTVMVWLIGISCLDNRFHQYCDTNPFQNQLHLHIFCLCMHQRRQKPCF